LQAQHNKYSSEMENKHMIHQDLMKRNSVSFDIVAARHITKHGMVA
jgi:hypothetical protein